MRRFTTSILALAVSFGLTAPAAAQTAPALSDVEMREFLEAAKATAKATRDTADYARVTPDMLFQVIAKLDKLENKLDKIENVLRAQQSRRGTR